MRLRLTTVKVLNSYDKHEKVAEFPEKQSKANSHNINTIKQVGIGVFLKKSIKNTAYVLYYII